MLWSTTLARTNGNCPRNSKRPWRQSRVRFGISVVVLLISLGQALDIFAPVQTVELSGLIWRHWFKYKIATCITAYVGQNRQFQPLPAPLHLAYPDNLYHTITDELHSIGRHNSTQTRSLIKPSQIAMYPQIRVCGLLGMRGDQCIIPDDSTSWVSYPTLLSCCFDLVGLETGLIRFFEGSSFRTHIA